MAPLSDNFGDEVEFEEPQRAPPIVDRNPAKATEDLMVPDGRVEHGVSGDAGCRVLGRPTGPPHHRRFSPVVDGVLLARGHEDSRSRSPVGTDASSEAESLSNDGDRGADSPPAPGAEAEEEEECESLSEEGEGRDLVRPLDPASLIRDLLSENINPREMNKWTEMIENGIAKYMLQHPDRFQRRVRRGIPQQYRWQVWKAQIGVHSGDPLMQTYREFASPSNPCTEQIKIDISRTFPEFFNAEWQQSLLRLLNAYAGYRPEIGYCQGMNFVAGLLLLVSGQREEECFVVLCRLMDSPEYGLAGFYRESLPLLRRYLRACDHLLKVLVPDVRDHFIKESVQPAVYLYQWFLTLFINCFPLPMVIIIWDVIICEGLPVILRIAVSILQVLKESLLNMHFEDIIKFFKKMKTYDDEEGNLNAARIGQLLMKHTEHVIVPDKTKEYLTTEGEVMPMDSDELWEVGPGQSSSNDMQSELNSNGWMHPSGWWSSITRIFSFGSSRRRSSSSYPSGTDSSRAGSDTSTPPPSLSNSSVNDEAAAAAGGDTAHADSSGGSGSPLGARSSPTTPTAAAEEGKHSAVTPSDPAPTGPGRGGSAAHIADSRLPLPSGASGEGAGGDGGFFSRHDWSAVGRLSSLGAAYGTSAYGASGLVEAEADATRRVWEFL